jgi:hypothetical protein
VSCAKLKILSLSLAKVRRCEVAKWRSGEVAKWKKLRAGWAMTQGFCARQSKSHQALAVMQSFLAKQDNGQ